MMVSAEIPYEGFLGELVSLGSSAATLEVVERNGGQVLAFSSPILCLFQQPLQITVTNNSAITAPAERKVQITLIGELAIQKVACR